MKSLNTPHILQTNIDINRQLEVDIDNAYKDNSLSPNLHKSASEGKFTPNRILRSNPLGKSQNEPVAMRQFLNQQIESSTKEDTHPSKQSQKVVKNKMS